jgi:ABC-type transport system involved in Fe-S cluster assembly fused permease/ATPase subunit
VLLTKYALVFTLVTFGTVVIYVGFTFAITEWRMDYRRQMNVLDSQANTQAFDSLLNYETVKYFGNERMELERYDGTLTRVGGVRGQEPEFHVAAELRPGQHHRARRHGHHVLRRPGRGAAAA